MRPSQRSPVPRQGSRVQSGPANYNGAVSSPMSSSDPDLASATGAGVSLALVDSGINPQHSHVRSVSGGIALLENGEGVIFESDDFGDRLGHGTALAGIIRAIAPQVELFAVRIFENRLAASVASLEAGLDWAIRRRTKIVTLSLGTINQEHRQRLEELVASAAAVSSLVVASSPPGRVDVLPAVLPGVIGVAGDDRCAWGEHLYFADDPIPFRAHPCPRPLPGPAQARNFRGHSFAAAHIAAKLARLVERRPNLTIDEARQYLAATALPPPS